MPYAAPTLSQLKRKNHPPKDYRPSSSKRGYGSKRWGIMCARVFRRDHYICQICNTATIPNHPDKSLRPQNDHIEPHRGDPDLMWDIDNMQTVHWSCHSRKTAKEDGGFGHANQD